MATKVVPIFDRVLIQRDEIQNKLEKTKSGLYVPEVGTQVDPRTGKINLEGKMEMNTGTVIACGEGVSHPDIQAGARVYFGKHAGAYIHPHRTERKQQLAEDKEPEVEDVKYFVCAEADIIAVLKEENENA